MVRGESRTASAHLLNSLQLSAAFAYPTRAMSILLEQPTSLTDYAPWAVAQIEQRPRTLPLASMKADREASVAQSSESESAVADSPDLEAEHSVGHLLDHTLDLENGATTSANASSVSRTDTRFVGSKTEIEGGHSLKRKQSRLCDDELDLDDLDSENPRPTKRTTLLWSDQINGVQRAQDSGLVDCRPAPTPRAEAIPLKQPDYTIYFFPFIGQAVLAGASATLPSNAERSTAATKTGSCDASGRKGVSAGQKSLDNVTYNFETCVDEVPSHFSGTPMLAAPDKRRRLPYGMRNLHIGCATSFLENLGSLYPDRGEASDRDGDVITSTGHDFENNDRECIRLFREKLPRLLEGYLRAECRTFRTGETWLQRADITTTAAIKTLSEIATASMRSLYGSSLSAAPSRLRFSDIVKTMQAASSRVSPKDRSIEKRYYRELKSLPVGFDPWISIVSAEAARNSLLLPQAVGEGLDLAKETLYESGAGSETCCGTYAGIPRSIVAVPYFHQITADHFLGGTLVATGELLSSEQLDFVIVEAPGAWDERSFELEP